MKNSTKIQLILKNCMLVIGFVEEANLINYDYGKEKLTIYYYKNRWLKQSFDKNEINKIQLL